MFEAPHTRRSAPKRLSYSDSVRFLNNIKRYLPVKSYGRTARLAELIGCDRRTAQRLLNAKEEEIPRLRKTYLACAAATTGETVMALVNKTPEHTEIQARMHMLLDGIPQLDQFKGMASLAASMAARCIFAYEMPASFSVDSDSKMNPISLRVKFRHNDDPGDVHEVAIVRDAIYKWLMVYIHPEFGQRFKGVINDDNFERILTFVKHKHKNVRLKKSSQRSSHSF